jgi:membrane-bound lytic murein transglycosylase MltF
MKTLVTLAVAFAFLTTPAWADLADVRKRGQLRVLVAEASPQFFGWKPGTRPGLEREILQGFCRLQRIDLAIIPLAGRGALFAALVKGDGDVAAGGLAATSALDGTVEFSAEVLPTRHVVVSRKPARTVLTLEELRALKIGTVKGTAQAEAVAGAGVPDAQIDDTLPPDALLPALKAGKVAACVVGVEQALPAQREDPDLLLGMYLGGHVSVAFGLRKEDVQLRAALNEYIGNLRRSAAWNRLVLSYFGESAADILKAAR